MKRLYFSFLLTTFACLAGYSQVDVTFTVDMSNETVDPAGVRISGAFTGWADSLMTDNGDGTYTLVFQLTGGDTLEWKFKNGPDGWEDIPGSACTTGGFGNNRLLIVPPSDTDATEEYCFGSCYACGMSGMTVSVDMANETVDPNGVFIAGGFNSWNDDPLTDNGDGTWSRTLVVETGTTYEYKFKNGADGWEAFDGDCLTGGAGSNRFFVGPAADSSAATVCFNSCDACMTGGGPSNITFTVDMSNETVSAEGVRMAGAFNGWSDTLMVDNGDGTWSLTLEMTSGDNVEYKFKNGPDGWENFGGPCLANGGNRFVDVPSADATLGTVCFNSCFACGEVGVTLTVDMQFETVAAEGVFIAGEFNGWTDTTSNDNGNGTWTGYFGATPGDTIEYKFKNGPNGWENFNGDCLFSGNGSNRWTPVPAQDTTIDVVCFNKCEACITYDSLDVTFRVDMTEQTVDPAGVFLAGSFNGFTDAPMTNMGDSIWALTLVLIPGDTVTYKFKNGPDGWEAIAETDCTDGSFGNNRLLVVPPQPKVLDAVCFGKCGVCFDATAVTTSSLMNSCKNANGTITIIFDESQNCDSAPGDLAGLAEIGFHSSGNMWADVIDWDAATAVTAVNDGNDVFSLTIDPAAYYGLDINDIERIMMVFNQGPAVPGSPWASEGKDQDLNEDGSCDDMRLFLDQMPACSFDPTTTSSPALKSAGSCYDPNNGLVKIRWDEAQNCPNAPGELAGKAEIGFHSGAASFTDVVEWNAANAQTAVNDGSDVFEVVIDPVSYYAGVNNFGDLQNIYMVFNQGPTDPGSPWGSEGKDVDIDNNCVDLRLIISDLPTCDLTNTIDRELENSLVAIPNPFGDKTIVSFSNPNNSAYEVTLFGLTGKQIRTFHHVTGTSLEVDRNDIPAGMYFLNFRNEAGKIATLKLVVK